MKCTEQCATVMQSTKWAFTDSCTVETQDGTINPVQQILENYWSPQSAVKKPHINYTVINAFISMLGFFF